MNVWRGLTARRAKSKGRLRYRARRRASRRRCREFELVVLSQRVRRGGRRDAAIVGAGEVGLGEGAEAAEEPQRRALAGGVVGGGGEDVVHEARESRVERAADDRRRRRAPGRRRRGRLAREERREHGLEDRGGAAGRAGGVGGGALDGQPGLLVDPLRAALGAEGPEDAVPREVRWGPWPRTTSRTSWMFRSSSSPLSKTIVTWSPSQLFVRPM